VVEVPIIGGKGELLQHFLAKRDARVGGWLVLKGQFADATHSKKK
jgi:hypothetical protein